MTISISDEQRMLRQSADRFLEVNAPVAQARTLRDNGEERAYSPHLWREMVEQGWPGIASPPEAGGSGLGHLGLGLVMESIGRHLSASPIHATVTMGIPWLASVANSSTQKTVLRSAVEGAALLSVALQEHAYYAPQKIETVAVEVEDGYLLTGNKVNVLDAGIANKFIVVARLWLGSPYASSLTAFLVDARAPGLQIRRVGSIDGRHVGELQLQAVRASSDDILGSRGGAARELQHVEDVVAAHAAAELLGISQRTFELTCDYTKQREQFGVKIGSFQALQHRLAHLFAELETSRALVFAALAAIDSNDEDSSALSSAAKARMSRVSQVAVGEAIQMHGGIGVTDDLDLGLYLKRAKVLQAFFGGDSFHLDRFARLKGY